MIRLLLVLLAIVTSARRRGRGSSTSEAAAVENAWKMHAAMADWTGKVDAKASFALAAESAALTLALSLRGDQGPFRHSAGCGAQLAFWSGIGLLSIAILLCVWVVIPQLRTRSLREEAKKGDYLHFGHVRHWEPEALHGALLQGSLLPVLTRNIVRSGRVAWTKHRRLQVSLRLAVVAVLLLATSSLLAHAWRSMSMGWPSSTPSSASPTLEGETGPGSPARG